MEVLSKIVGGLTVFVPVLVLIFNSGCASTGPELKRVSDAEYMLVLSGAELSLDQELSRDLPDEDVMGLTEDMKVFVRRAVSR